MNLGIQHDSAPEAFSTVPMYFTVKTNKHSLQTFITILGTVSALQEKLARSEPFQELGQRCQEAEASFPNSSQWRESWVREDAWTSGTALKGFGEGGPVGNAWNSLKLAPFQTPKTKKAFKGESWRNHLYGDLLGKLFTGAWMQATANRAISVPTRRRLTISGF